MVAMHVFLARPGGGKTKQQQFLSLQSLLPVLEMSEAQRIARAINSFANDGFDMMGGADGAALAEMLTDYIATPTEAQPLDESKTTGIQ